MPTYSVTQISITRFTNDLHAQFHTQQKDMILKSTVDEIREHDAFKKYCEAIATEEAISKKVSKSEFTEEISVKDAGRDDVYKIIVDTTKMNTRISDGEVKEAAKRIEIVLDDAGDITKKPLNAQTSAVNNVLEQLNGRLKEDTEKIGIDKLVAKLAEFNSQVEELMMTRYDESVSKITVNLRDQRKIVDDLYRLNIKRLESLMTLNGEANYLDLFNHINVVIAGYEKGRVATKPNPSEPKKPETPVVEDKYPDALEWHDEVRVAESNAGDIFFVMVEGKKVYYKLLDRYLVSKVPGSAGNEKVWELLA